MWRGFPHERLPKGFADLRRLASGFPGRRAPAVVPTAVVAKWCDNSVEMIEQKYLDNKVLEQMKPL
ncbi:MAG: hypothetical protein KME31_20645 [Tolypothrix carrinoi HA7290-LM1]|jgi:hypothetical protein|nr:hypothetical protein [Tolypothrix carrinoi HA7290-LM1]